MIAFICNACGERTTTPSPLGRPGVVICETCARNPRPEWEDLTPETEPMKELALPGPDGPTEPPTCGSPITPGELLTMLLVREGDRDDALDFLSETLGELGITGEEIAHWQKRPGICHDSTETMHRMDEEWRAKANTFPKKPLDLFAGYWKKDAPPWAQT